jgi:hypothetical protein
MQHQQPGCTAVAGNVAPPPSPNPLIDMAGYGVTPLRVPSAPHRGRCPQRANIIGCSTRLYDGKDYFVLAQYIKWGMEERDQAKLGLLLELKYNSINDVSVTLGRVADQGDVQRIPMLSL